MRFSELGPPIPRELIKAQEDGEVVFLCGAGISGAAGLPGFEQLTRDVLRELGAEITPGIEGQIRQYSFDKIFTKLEEDFTRPLVDSVVYNLLETGEKSFAGNHKTILALSKSSQGQPQVITTNYDLLFEKAAKESEESLKTYESGSFPRLIEGGSLNGLVYLHGRMTDSLGNGTMQNFVLSESDFGKAYLSGALATQLLLEVIRSKCLVLVGYSGNDPVVQYLFRGLSALPNSSEFRIYAFNSDPTREGRERWKRLGVTSLVYDSSKGHKVLWDSLEAWANFVVDPDSWSKKMLTFAQKDPSQAKPYERGQMTAMVSTRHGARVFASKEFGSHTTWLLVFDSVLRRQLGLKTDDDPKEDEDGVFEDFLSTNTTANDFAEQTVALASYRNSQEVQLPLRLSCLRAWISRNCDDPVVIWWLSGFRRAGPELLWDLAVESERRKKDLKGGAHGVLSLLIDFFREPLGESRSFEWHSFESQIRNHGWNRETVREFRRVTKPKLKVERGLYGESVQKLYDGQLRADELKSEGLVNFEVLFPMIDVAKMKPPADELFGLLRILSDHLYLASSYLSSVDRPSFREGTLHQPEKPDFYQFEGKLRYLHAVARLFDRLVEHDVKDAHVILSLWDPRDEEVQGQLVLYALHKGRELGIKFSVEKILSLPDAVLWCSASRRERLFALQAIWSDLENAQREQLEKRVLRGDHSYPSDDPERDRVTRSYQAATTLGYLLQNSCFLSAEALTQYEELIEGIEDWKEEWCELSGEEFDRGARPVLSDENIGDLAEVPLSELLNRAKKLSGRDSFAIDKVPFRGLVKLSPRRAFLALSLSSRSGKVEVGFWRQMLNDLPDNADPMLRLLIVKRVLLLPDRALSELGRTFSSWLKKNAEEFYRLSQQETLSTWASILDRFSGLSESAFESDMGRTFVGGKELNRSSQSYINALNSVAGELSEIALSLGRFHLKEKERKLPSVIENSFEKIFSFPGEGKVAGVCVVVLNSRWLHWLDSDWYCQNILPFSAGGSPVREAALNGFIHNRYVPDPEVMRLYREDILDFIRSAGLPAWDDNELGSLITKIVYSALHPVLESRVFAYQEVREVLKILGRGHSGKAIDTVRQMLKQDGSSWDLVGAPFFRSVWPKEAAFQTEESSRQIFYLLLNCGSNFPERLDGLIELLRPIEHADVMIHELDEDETDTPLWHEFPEDTLKILDRLIPSAGIHQPYNLIPFLEKIVREYPDLRFSPAYRSIMERS